MQQLSWRFVQSVREQHGKNVLTVRGGLLPLGSVEWWTSAWFRKRTYLAPGASPFLSAKVFLEKWGVSQPVPSPLVGGCFL
jgi:hypothetical protein